MTAILLEPFVGYKLYTAMKLHFTKDSYDFFKNGGRTKIKGRTFDEKTDVSCYINLTTSVPKKDILQYLLANFVEGNYNVVYNIPNGTKIYRQWCARIDSLSYNFQLDIEKICSEMEEMGTVDIASIFHNEDGCHPILLRMYMGGHISIETMCILETRLEYIEQFDISMEYDIIWHSNRKKIVKYLAFFSAGTIQINNDRIDNILMKYIGVHTKNSYTK